MRARSKARKRALDVLYEADLRGVPTSEVLSTQLALPDRPVNPYTTVLVEGVAAHRDRIDELLAAYSEGWTVARMPVVDRNVLRIGVWELLYAPDIPEPVAISEAVELVAELSRDESPAFVNGLLSRIRELKATLAGE